MFTQEKQVTPSRECPPRCPDGVLRLDSEERQQLSRKMRHKWEEMSRWLGGLSVAGADRKLG